MGDYELKVKYTAVYSMLMALAVSAEPLWLTPSDIAVTKDGNIAYVACEGAGLIDLFDIKAESSKGSFKVEGIRELALSPDGTKIYATAGEFNGRIVEIDALTGEVMRDFACGHTPMSPLISADGLTLYYCNRFARQGQADIFALDIKRWSVSHSATAIREPITMQLSRDGRFLWVVNHLPLMEANREHVFASLGVYSTKKLKQVVQLDLPPGSFAIRGSVMSNNGKYFFVSHTIGRFTVPTTHLDRGWINTSAISVFDAVEQRYLNTVLLDDTMQGAANPWGVAVTPDDKYLCVSISGTHEVIFVDITEMMKRLAAAPKPGEVMNDLSFLYGAKTRVKMEGEGARAIAVYGSFVYVPMRYADTINVIEIWDDGPGGALSFPLREMIHPPDAARAGEMAFNDATLCYQSWQSCASCHPDTRSDATNWDLLNDGIGNPKQSRSMLYTHRTSPVMIRGVRAAAEIAVSKGFSAIHFFQVEQSCEDAVNAYLKALEPVPSPYLTRDGGLTESAQRGKKIFEGQAGCVKCHTPPYYGDKKLYKLGLGTDGERDCEFATPILIECWRTAPYMYDGRAVSIQDVITTDNKFNTHGNTKDLSRKEVEDLAEYVNSL